MAHPYKSFDEHRHGRAVAKKRGYAQGGAALSDYSAQMQQADSSFAERARQRMNDQMNVPVETARSRYQARPLGRAKGGRIKGYDDGGKVLNYPGSAAMADARRMHFHNKYGFGPHPNQPGFSRPSNVTELRGAGSKPRPTDRPKAEDLPHAKGGRVKRGMSAGAESGVGKLQKAKMQARLRKK